jgi:REP element-mobilizing transposase RayT
MAHKFPNILIHLVFSTKNRRDLIPDELRILLWKYLAGIGRNHKIPVLVVGGTANHVHVLISLPTDVPVAKAVQILKANSSRWMGEHGIDFAWQEGYGAFSVRPRISRSCGITLSASSNTMPSGRTKMSSSRCLGRPAWDSNRNRCLARVPSLAGLGPRILALPALPCRAILFRRFAAGIVVGPRKRPGRLEKSRSLSRKPSQTSRETRTGCTLLFHAHADILVPR